MKKWGRIPKKTRSSEPTELFTPKNWIRIESRTSKTNQSNSIFAAVKERYMQDYRLDTLSTKNSVGKKPTKKVTQWTQAFQHYPGISSVQIAIKDGQKQATLDNAKVIQEYQQGCIEMLKDDGNIMANTKEAISFGLLAGSKQHINERQTRFGVNEDHHLSFQGLESIRGRLSKVKASSIFIADTIDNMDGIQQALPESMILQVVAKLMNKKSNLSFFSNFLF